MDHVFLSGSIPHKLSEVYRLGTSEASGEEGSRQVVSVAAPKGAASSAPDSLIAQHFAPPSDPLGEPAAFRASDGRITVLDAQVVEDKPPQHRLLQVLRESRSSVSQGPGRKPSTLRSLPPSAQLSTLQSLHHNLSRAKGKA